MSNNKVKITVRFAVEQDFEVEVRDEKLGLGSVFCVGDNMVSGGMDLHDLMTHDNIFDNPVSEFRGINNEHIYECNFYNLGLGNKYTNSWLLEGEKDDDPYADDEGVDNE